MLNSQRLHIQQVYESFEILLGFECRNKYRIYDEAMNQVAYAAEISDGIFGAILRQFLGHWRKFHIHIYDSNRTLLYQAQFPFRWFFKTLYLKDSQGKSLGYIQQRFAFFQKKFDLYDAYGVLFGTIRSPWFKPWTYEVRSLQRKLGTIQKKWSGIFTEIFTDKDNYVVSFADPNLSEEQRALLLSMTLMADIVYFENKGGGAGSSLLDMAD